ALAMRLRPDVVMLDADLPDVAGLITRLAADPPAARVVILSAGDDARQTVTLVCAGARGYLSKHATREALIGALRAVSRGELILEATALKAVVGQLADHQSGVVDVTATFFDPRIPSPVGEDITDRSRGGSNESGCMDMRCDYATSAYG